MTWLLLLQLATWFPVQPPVLHYGTWQSCDGAERILQHYYQGRVRWELHLGPDDEFALYRDPQPDEHDHNEKNLLGLAYHYSAIVTKAGGRTWTAPSLGLQVNVVAAGEHKSDNCYEFYVKVETRK